MSKYVKLRLEVALNEHQLAALLWDALDGEATPAALAALSSPTVRQLVRTQVTNRGVRSVDCGPTNEEGYDGPFEEACLRAVRRAY